MIAGAICKSVLNAYYKGTEIIIQQGGSSSAKTHDILNALVILALKEKDLVISITGASLPGLRKDAIRILESILKDEGLYDPNKHNKTNLTYEIGTSIIEVFSAYDDKMSRHGKRHILYCNEVNLFELGVFKQMHRRTKRLSIVDYNPSAAFWVHDTYVGKEGVEFYISTIDNNPIINEESERGDDLRKLRKKLDSEKEIDIEAYNVYRLGMTGNVNGLIFRQVKYVPNFPECKKIAYGLDFGYTNDPTSLSKCGVHQGEWFGKELCYETGMSDEDIIKALEDNGVKKSDIIVADGSDPRLIAKIKSKGYSIRAAKKGADSVNYGISALKKYKMNLTVDSINAKKEQQNYKWKEKDGVSLNEPIDKHNHFWDSCRYANEYLLDGSLSGVRRSSGSTAA